MLYNAALEERIDAYRKTGKSPDLYDQMKSLTLIRQGDADWRQFPCTMQRGALKRLDRAYQAFFRRVRQGGKAGFPRFKGQGRFTSLEWGQVEGFTFKMNHQHWGKFTARGLGSISVRVHRPLPDDATINALTRVRRVSCNHSVRLISLPPQEVMRTGQIMCYKNGQVVCY